MKVLARFLSVCFLALLLASPAQAQYDILIRNGRLLDGTGNPWRQADVGIVDGRITAVGDLSDASAETEIDAEGLYVSPGFIDPHSHAGPGLTTEGLSQGQPILAQGVTTVMINPDGGGNPDLAAQSESLLRYGLGPNVVQLVPHGGVRGAVMGPDDRDPTPRELDEMREMVREGMEQGAWGLSSGPYYAPGSFSETEELIELAKVAAQYNGVYISHIRDEADYTIGVVAAVDEVIRIAREANITGIVTHIKALGPRVWGYSQVIIDHMQQARREGLRIYADQYPYEASGTSIGGALIPRWAQAGGRDSLNERLTNPETRDRVRSDIIENLDRRGGANRLQFQRHVADPSIEGSTLGQVAEQRGVHPADLAMDLQLAGGAGLVSFNMDDGDIANFMRQPWTMTSSDGGLVPMGQGVPHPRYYGPFPRKIRKYVLEEEVLTLPAAIRTMTSLTAGVFGMNDRGLIREGTVADVIVFDLERLTDVATYTDPHHLSEGMVHVIVNGQFAIQDGEFTGEMPGQVLQKGR